MNKELVEEGEVGLLRWKILIGPFCYLSYIGIPLTLNKWTKDNPPDINVHWGITYFSVDSDLGKGYAWVGWDYAHCSDLISSTYFTEDNEIKDSVNVLFEQISSLFNIPLSGNKQIEQEVWTLEQIKKEMQEALFEMQTLLVVDQIVQDENPQ